jgi:hypothetical protein
MKRLSLLLITLGALLSTTPARAAGWYLIEPPGLLDYKPHNRNAQRMRMAW